MCICVCPVSVLAFLVCMSVCPSVSVCLSVCVFVSMDTYVSVYICLSVCLSVCVCVCVCLCTLTAAGGSVVPHAQRRRPGADGQRAGLGGRCRRARRRRRRHGRALQLCRDLAVDERDGGVGVGGRRLRLTHPPGTDACPSPSAPPPPPPPTPHRPMDRPGVPHLGSGLGSYVCGV